MGHFIFLKQKPSLSQIIPQLIVVGMTFFAPLSNAQTADPVRLLPKTYSKIRCEILFTNFASFVQNRQRTLLTPMTDINLEQKFSNWMGRLNNILKLEDPLRADFDEITIATTRLNKAEKTDLSLEIAAIYKEVTAEKYRAIKLKELKRTLDLILSRIERPDLLFTRNGVEHKNAWTLYSQYFKEARSHAGLPNDYSPQEIWNLTHWMRQRLRSEQKVVPELNGAEIVVYGSFVNGRAILKSSDIDAIANNSATARFVDRLNDDPYFKTFNVDHIAANSMAKFSEWSASQLSPLIFIVSADHIIMKVYPPMTYAEISAKSTHERPMTFIYD